MSSALWIKYAVKASLGDTRSDTEDQTAAEKTPAASKMDAAKSGDIDHSQSWTLDVSSPASMPEFIFTEDLQM